MKKLVSILTLFAACIVASAQTSPIVRVDTLNALQALPIPTVNSSFMAVVGGQSAVGDGPYGGLFFYSSGATDATNTFSVFKPTTTTGRWIRITSNDYNQKTDLTPASEDTYALQIRRNYVTHSLGLGGTASYAYINSWNSLPLQINGVGANDTIFNLLGGNVGIAVAPVEKLTVGGTMRVTGGVTLGGTSLSITNTNPSIGLDTAATDRYLDVNTASGNGRYMRATTAGSLRWRWGAGNTAETGSDAGSQFLVQAFTDAGALIDTPIQVVRAASGAITVARPVTQNSKTTTYNSVATAGWGVPSIYAAARSTAQAAAVASVATYTVGAADGSFEVSANVLVTTATTHNFTVTCAYTDEGSTARTITMPFRLVDGSSVTAIANAAGAVPYHGERLQIRAKAATAITIATTGTFTTVVYNVEGNISQIN